MKQFIQSETRQVWFAALAYWVVFAILATLLYPVTMSDSITRYAPMADAFARGDWMKAFHPRFGVLFSVLSGSLAALTGMSGEHAIQVTGIGFLALSGVPIFFLVKRLFSSRIAWMALVLLFVSDDLTRYAMDGLRDSGKCLAFALMGYGIVARRPIWMGFGLFMLISLFSYGFALGSVLVFVWCVGVLIVAMRKKVFDGEVCWSILWPSLGWALGTAAVTILTHAYTGHWLPAPHFIKFLGGWL